MFFGATTYLLGRWNATMQLNEKGCHFTPLLFGLLLFGLLLFGLLLFGLFAAVSLQKSVRDRLRGIPVTGRRRKTPRPAGPETRLPLRRRLRR